MATASWAASTSRTTGVSAQAITTGANYLGSEIDNSSNKDRWCDIEIKAVFGTGPTAETPVMVYILYAIDGTNYEDGDTSPIDPQKGPVASLPARNAATTQILTTVRVPLSPHKFKLLVRNETNQTSTTTVLLRTYNEVMA